MLADLRAGEEQALVDLFAADSALGRAEERAQMLEGRLAGVRDRVEETRAQPGDLAVNLQVARQLLTERIEQWYRMDEIDAIEIILGSDSLSDVIDQFDAIERMTSRDADVVRGTRDFAAETNERQRSLRDQEEQVEQLVAAARAEADRLAAARAAKESLVADLRRQASFTGARIDRARPGGAGGGGTRRRDRGRGGRERRRLADGGPAALGRRRRQTDAGVAARTRATRETPPPDASGGQQITVSATAYSIHGTTASGLPTAYGVCATDPGVIPMGTSFSVPGLRDVRGGRHRLGHHRQHHRRLVPGALAGAGLGPQTVTITILG